MQSVAYVTKAQMIDRYGDVELAQLTDFESAATIDDDILNGAIDDAADEIDSYIQVRYGLPLDVAPRVLIRINADIARYRLYRDEAPDAVATRYQDAVRQLKDVAAGRADLGLDGDDEEVDAPAGAVHDAQTRINGRDNLGGF